MATATTTKMPGTPKPSMNTAMRTMLGLPVLRRLLGGLFAVITVTGAKTGRRYTTPVQYMRLGGDYVVLSQRHRVWWRNLRTRPELNLTIGGETIRGRARLPVGEDDVPQGKGGVEDGRKKPACPLPVVAEEDLPGRAGGSLGLDK